MVLWRTEKSRSRQAVTGTGNNGEPRSLKEVESFDGLLHETHRVLGVASPDGVEFLSGQPVVVFEEGLDLRDHLRPEVGQRCNVPVRVGLGGDADQAVVALLPAVPFGLPRFDSPDHPHLDDAARKRGGIDDDEDVERIAVAALGRGNISIIVRERRSLRQHALQLEDPELPVVGVFVAAALGRLDDDQNLAGFRKGRQPAQWLRFDRQIGCSSVLVHLRRNACAPSRRAGQHTRLSRIRGEVKLPSDRAGARVPPRSPASDDATGQTSSSVRGR